MCELDGCTPKQPGWTFISTTNRCSVLVMRAGRTPTHTPDGNHFEINDGKVSRHHATIGYDEVSGSFKLTCHSSNGVDCNGK